MKFKAFIITIIVVLSLSGKGYPNPGENTPSAAGNQPALQEIVLCPTKNQTAGELYNKGLELSGKGDFESAMKAYSRAIELDANYCDAMDNLGQLLRRQGKFEEAEQELENRIRAKIESQATTRATDQAFEAMKVQIEVDRYLNDLRGQNPDLVDWEPYLTAPVEKRIGQARVEGKIKNSDDFLRIYKDSVKAEVDTLREKTLKYRAQGQQNATTRINDVRNASTLQPQAVTSTPSEQTSEAPIETVDSYIARRQAASQKAHGMV